MLYTDGITEPENEYGEDFGEQRLRELLVGNADRDGAEITAEVVDAVRRWTAFAGGTAGRHDAAGVAEAVTMSR